MSLSAAATLSSASMKNCGNIVSYFCAAESVAAITMRFFADKS